MAVGVTEFSEVIGTDDDRRPILYQRATSPRAKILRVTLPATLALAAAAMFLPTGFVVRAPGPTEDALGAQTVRGQEIPLVEVDGVETFPTTGELRLTTVTVAGGPIGPVLPLDALAAWAMPGRSVLPVESVFATGVTREQQAAQSAQQMVTSQQAATAAALTDLGFEIPTTMTVVGVNENSGAVGLIEPDDIVRKLEGVDILTMPQLMEKLGQIEPGSTVVFTVERNGELIDVPIETGRTTNADGSERAVLGVFLRSDFNFPVDVEIQIDNIGGPSAGMMFALAIIDRMTELDELQGVAVAGTGTISVDGQVGPIGGIVQKMHGALRDGAHWFLAPLSNCGEVVGAVPHGLNVVAVSTLHEAREAITAIGAGAGAQLPTCS